MSGGLPLKKKLSENTLNRTTNGFKRYNIMENNTIKSTSSSDDNPDIDHDYLKLPMDLPSGRKSLLIDNEYESSDESSQGQIGNGDDSIDIALKLTEDTDKNNNEDSNLRQRVPTQPNLDNVKIPTTTSAKLVFKHVLSSKVKFSRNGEMRSNFNDLNFLPRETIFDREIHFGTKFYGFYVAIWIMIAFFGLNVLIGYHLDHGSIFGSEIMKLMLKDIWKVALMDLGMYLSMYFAVIIQLAIKHKLIKWKYIGFTIASIYEILLLILPLYYSDKLDFPWIAQIFIMLHSVVMLMKVHSYSFFNGYLWEIVNELEFSTIFIDKKDVLNDNIVIALKNSIEFCKFEIKSQDFPNNINFKNFFNYSMFPVLVYQNEYPRNKRIRKSYLLSKILGIFGVILLMITVAQYRIYPIVMKCLYLQKNETFWFRLKNYPFILIEFIPPFLCIYLLVFYLIWELILNAIAELSRFADREFYRYWWNSIDWNEYARDWNVPVHKFLLRHVYHSSISAFKVPKTLATFLTFFLSSIIHELSMYVIFKKIRFYLLLLQMSQLVLVQVSKTKWMKDKYILGNCIFWFGIVFGPSLMCTMYLVF